MRRANVHISSARSIFLQLVCHVQRLLKPSRSPFGKSRAELEAECRRVSWKNEEGLFGCLQKSVVPTPAEEQEEGEARAEEAEGEEASRRRRRRRKLKAQDSVLATLDEF